MSDRDGKIRYSGSKCSIRAYLKSLVRARDFEIYNISALYPCGKKDGEYSIIIFGRQETDGVGANVYEENRKMVDRYWATGMEQRKRIKSGKTDRNKRRN